MATTMTDILTRLSYRLGENGIPTNLAEKARRVSFINEGFRRIIAERLWWFSQTESAQPAVAGVSRYQLPDGYRGMLELRYNRRLVIPFPDTDAYRTYQYPPLSAVYYPITMRFLVSGNQTLELVPEPSVVPAVLTLASLTSSGSIATATTSADHGLMEGDFVVIAGATPDGYNGTHRIRSVPSTTTYTFEIPGSLATPATGTITAQEANIRYRYFTTYGNLTEDSTDVIIPDQFADVLVAYAFGRYGLVDDSRGSSIDGFSEYNDLLVMMQREQTRRQFMNNHTTSPSTLAI